MRARFSRGFSIVLMLACTLIGNTVLAGSASAAPSAEGAVPVPGELVTTFVARALPGSPGCLPSTVSKVLPDRKRRLIAGVSCSSRAVIPPAITLSAGFESKSGDAFVAKVSALAGVSPAEAAEAVAGAAGVAVSQLSTMTVAGLGRSILLTQAGVTDVTQVPDAAEKTNVCIKQPNGSSSCASVTNPLAEGLLWGAIGARIGAGIGGAVGAVVGALIGFIIGLL